MARPMKPMNARQRSWAHQIDSNHHEMLILSHEEVETIINTSPAHEQNRLKQLWAEHRGKLEFSASWGATGVDSVALKRLIWDLGFGWI